MKAIADSDAALNIAIAPDYPPASTTKRRALASAQGLDLLELVAADGTIISSAEWPARFGYKEDGWRGRIGNRAGRFLRREELPDRMTLALVAVRTATAATGDLRRRRPAARHDFLSTLVLPTGMRVLLWRDLGTDRRRRQRRTCGR